MPKAILVVNCFGLLQEGRVFSGARPDKFPAGLIIKPLAAGGRDDEIRL
jgi:hypothetical protein